MSRAKLIIGCLVILAVLLGTGCTNGGAGRSQSSSDGASPTGAGTSANNLVGEWKTDVGAGTVQFEDDGQFVQSDGVRGTYRLSGGELRLSYASQNGNGQDAVMGVQWVDPNHFKLVGTNGQQGSKGFTRATAGESEPAADSGSSDPQLIGSWAGSTAGRDVGFVFAPDNTYTATQGFNGAGTYNVNGNALHLIYATMDGTQHDDEFTVEWVDQNHVNLGLNGTTVEFTRQ